jgi:hypothetical protein
MSYNYKKTSKLKKTFGIFATCVLILIIFWYFYQTKEIALTIKESSGREFSIKLSRCEARDLEVFFLHNICHEGWAYTLFGYKPISFGCKDRFFSSIASIIPPAYGMREGWKVWQKIQSQLPHSRFVIWCEHSPWSVNFDCIFIANRESVSETLRLNAEDFQNLLPQPFMNSGELLDEASKKSLITDVLHQDEMLLGILLGFGRGNAYWFCHTEDHTGGFIWEPEIEIPIVESYMRKTCTFRDPEISDMLLPAFVGEKNSTETINLKQKYLSARQKIIKHYQGKPFLETTLSLLVNGPPDEE